VRTPSLSEGPLPSPSPRRRTARKPPGLASGTPCPYPKFRANELRAEAPTGLAAHEAAVIAAALAILDARLREAGTLFESPTKVKDFLRLHLAHREAEAFCVVFLDAQNRLIAFDVMFEGTVTQTSVFPREVVKRALRHNACAAILAHNHPSGTAEPSRQDEFLTQTLKSALALIDVRVLDHMVVGGRDVCSLAERGLV
jgi:DNA repair protein RadC